MRPKLSVSIATASGAVYRWGPDEWEAKNIPQAISFSTVMPGGFKGASITLPRRIDLDYADLNLLDTVQILGPGNEVVWEGRVQQLPRSHSETFSIQVGAVGWAAHLVDDASFREIYIDCELSAWQAPSTKRQLDLLAGSYALSAGSQVAPSGSEGSAGPTIVFDFTGVTATPTFNEGQEMWYPSGGVNLGHLLFDQVGDATTTWEKYGALCTDDHTFAEKSPNYSGLNENNGQGVHAAGTGRKYACLGAFYTNNGFSGQMTNLQRWRNVKVLGNHGLPQQGTWPNVGFYASDVIADVVSRAAPFLNYSTGTSGSIQPSTFVIPHLVFREPTTALAVIMLANGYHLWEWGVWKNREFFFREPSAERLTWETRLSDGARLDLEGTQVDDLYNGVLVQYTDPTGVSRTAGPPGSGADATSSSLVDLSASNPVNAHGIPRKWALLSLSQTTTQEGAVQLGAIFLGEKSLPQRRGQLVLTGTVSHPTAGTRPACTVLAGDWVRIADHPADIPRKIIETNYDAQADTMTCSLDNTSQQLDAILERLGVSLIGVL